MHHFVHCRTASRSYRPSGVAPRLLLRAIATAPFLCLALPVSILAQAAAPSAVSPAPTQQPFVANPIAASQTATANTATTAYQVNPQAETSTSLSSSQIFVILEQHPDAIVEIKSIVANRSAQSESDITDEALYNQIAGSPGLRAAITTYLRARGYLPGDGGSLADVTPVTPEPATNTNSAPFPSSQDALAYAAMIGRGQSDSNEVAPNRGTDSVMPTQPLGRALPSTAYGVRQPPEHVTSSTDEPRVLRVPTPYNLRSMRDLYTQVPDPTVPLKRFGSELFVAERSLSVSRSAGGQGIPLDVPIGPDYILGAGDTLTIDLWGGATQSMTRSVDRDGKLLLPEAGSLNVGGLSLARAQTLIEAALQAQYRNAHVSVTVSSLRSVRIYVAGDVQRPGGYDVSALATPLSALYAAGGPTAAGSLRMLRHMRGDQLVEQIDLYDFFLHGIHAAAVHFESGDTLLVPPVGAQVAVFGAVLRPAIYELKAAEAPLSSLFDDAGGLTVAASIDHIYIDRVDAGSQRETVRLVAASGVNADPHLAIAAFSVRDGDRIYIPPILPYSQSAIYLEGHVVRPGRLPFKEGLRLADILHSYQDMLPEPAAHGEIVRLVPPDLHAETVDFSLPDVLIGNSNPALQPFDTIRVFGRYEIDPPKVTISGEVLRPGVYPLSKGMTASQLVRAAGGFKRDALLDAADLTSYSVVNGNRVVSSLTAVHIGAAVGSADAAADVLLKPGDILTIHQVTGWSDIGASVQIEGQVGYPGSYGLRDGERLSSVLRRAGGMRDTAYAEGAVLVRDEVRTLEEKSRQELIRQIETSSAAARLSSNLGNDTNAALQAINSQQEQILTRLKEQPATGRLVVHIDADINSWANTPADIELRRGDLITIPRHPGFVLVTGQVYNATALTFTPGKNAGWYLSHAGGANSTADRKEILIIRANGSVIGRRSGHWGDNDVLATKLDPGDVVVVPQRIIGSSQLWRNLMTAAQLAASISITAAVAAL